MLMKRLLVIVAVVGVACARYEVAPGYEGREHTPAPPECSPPPGSVATTMVSHGPDVEPSSIAGVVQDEHGRLLDGVTLIRRAQTVFRATSDSVGRFRFRALPPGGYEFMARRPGYSSATDSLRVSPGVTRTYAVTLPVEFIDGPCVPVVWQQKPWWKWW